MNRRRIVFKVKDTVILDDARDLTEPQIEYLKWFVVAEVTCKYDEVDVEFVEPKHELSDIDITDGGMFNWKSTNPNFITGFKLKDIVEGSDEYLDAIANGTLEDDYLEFD